MFLYDYRRISLESTVAVHVHEDMRYEHAIAHIAHWPVLVNTTRYPARLGMAIVW